MLADRAASAGVRIEVAMADTAGLPDGTVPEGVHLSASWGEIFEDDTLAAAILDRLLGNAVVINIRGESYRMRTHRRLLEETRKGVITKP